MTYHCIYPKKLVTTFNNYNNRIERSLISPEYANRFIREFII